MPTIKKNDFAGSFEAGTVEQLRERAQGKGVALTQEQLAAVRSADLNGDGVVGNSAAEKDKLWRKIDSFDRNGDSNSVSEGRGSAFAIANGLMARRTADGQRTAEAALSIVDGPEAAQWGIEQNDRAPIHNPKYSGGGPDGRGGFRSPEVLAGRWKCSVFAGEVLYRSGFEPPYSSWRPGSGDTRHYEQAVSWHKHTEAVGGQPALFSSLENASDLRAGDIVTFQRFEDGKWSNKDNGGHCMVVTAVHEGPPRKVEIAEAGSSEAQHDNLAGALAAEGVYGNGEDVQSRLDSMNLRRDRYGTYHETTENVRVRFLRPIAQR